MSQELIQQDEEARRVARSEFDRPLLLVAGAGTGKTATLVARVVTWITGPGWELARERVNEPDNEKIAQNVLSGVVAITFTEPAAAEMQKRISEALKNLLVKRKETGFTASDLGIDLETLDRRLRALSDELDALNASTFHSWCQGLLQQNSFRAGLNPSLTIDAQRNLQALYLREAFEELLATKDEDVQADLVALTTLGFPPSKLEEHTYKLLGAGATSADVNERDFRDSRVGEAIWDVVRRALQPFDHVASGLADVNQPAPRLLVTHLPEFTRRLAGPAPASPADWIELSTWLQSCFAKSVPNKLKSWAKETLTKGEAKAIDVEDHHALFTFAQRFQPVLKFLMGQDFDGSARFARLAGEVLRRTEELAIERGAITFDSIIANSARLLATDEALAHEVRSEIDLLLVDEFQDTNGPQCSIVESLALRGAKRPSLFLVGDPKQSIYAFRGADMAAFDSFTERVEAAGGGRIELFVNFRSAPAILDEVKRISEPNFERIVGLQPVFAELIANPERKASPLPESASAPIEHWVGWELVDEVPTRTDARANDRYREEGVAIAQDIVRLKATDPELDWTDVAILLRSQSGVEHILEPLREAGVPFSVQADRSYFQRREVVDAVSAIRVLFDPFDRIALVGLLRSPFVGVPDAALLGLWNSSFPDALSTAMRTGDSAPALAALQAASSLPAPPVPGIERLANWPTRLSRIVEGFVVLASELDHGDLFGVLSRLRHLTAQESVESARYLGDWRVANLEKFWTRLEGLITNEGLDRHGLLATLKKDISPTEAEPSKMASRATKSAVQVMTMHGSKGLEFPHVYLAQLGRKAPASLKPIFLRSADPELPVASAWSIKNFATPAFTLFEEREKLVDAAQQVRLLYVAATRAKERLVLSSGWNERSPSSWKTAESLDQLVRNRELLPSVFDGEEELAIPGADSSEAHWRLTNQHARLEPWTGAGQDDAVDSEQLVALIRKRHERARGAEQRRARPRTAGPSSRTVATTMHVDRRSTDPELARRVGTLVHRWLEADGDASLANLAQSEVRSGPVDELVSEAQNVLDAARSSGLLERLEKLAPHVIARELPYLAPAPDDPAAPVDAELGVIDLVLDDPAEPGLTVVDFKTEAVDLESLDAAAAHHRPQLDAYAARVEAFTGSPVGREIWFLRAGRVVRL